MQMNKINYICQALEILIQTEWDKLPIPDDESICKPEKSPSYIESSEITEWIKGKKFSEITNSNNFEAQMPFYYLTASAASYYVGGYLLQSCKNISKNFNGVKDCFGFDHLSVFVASPNFGQVFSLMNCTCKIILLSFIEMILIVEKELEINQVILDGIQRFLVTNLWGV